MRWLCGRDISVYGRVFSAARCKHGTRSPPAASRNADSSSLTLASLVPSPLSSLLRRSSGGIHALRTMPSSSTSRPTRARRLTSKTKRIPTTSTLATAHPAAQSAHSSQKRNRNANEEPNRAITHTCRDAKRTSSCAGVHVGQTCKCDPGRSQSLQRLRRHHVCVCGPPAP